MYSKQTGKFLALYVTKVRNKCVVERFLSGLINVHGKQPISKEESKWYV